MIGEPDGNGAYVLRLYYNPLVPWIWLGAVVMAFGGLVRCPTGGTGSAPRRGGARPVAAAAPAQAAE